MVEPIVQERKGGRHDVQDDNDDNDASAFDIHTRGYRRMHRMPMGVKRAYTVAQLISLGVLKDAGVQQKCQCIYDDWITGGDSMDDAATALAALMVVIDRICLELNLRKCVLKPTQRIIFMGMLLDLINKTRSLDPDWAKKCTDLLQQLQKYTDGIHIARYEFPFFSNSICIVHSSELVIPWLKPALSCERLGVESTYISMRVPTTSSFTTRSAQIAVISSSSLMCSPETLHPNETSLSSLVPAPVAIRKPIPYVEDASACTTIVVDA